MPQDPATEQAGAHLLRVLLQTEDFRSFLKLFPGFIFPWNIFEGLRAAEGIKQKVDYLCRRIGKFHDSLFSAGENLSGKESGDVGEIDVQHGENSVIVA